MEKLTGAVKTKRTDGTCEDRRDNACRSFFALIFCEISTNKQLPFFRQSSEIFPTGRQN